MDNVNREVPHDYFSLQQNRYRELYSDSYVELVEQDCLPGFMKANGTCQGIEVLILRNTLPQ